MPDCTLVTAATPDYMAKLKWSMSTWTLKPQLAGMPLLVFWHKLSPEDRQWVMDFWPGPSVELVEWTMPEYDGVRELMLSSFVLGAAKHVKTPHYIKMDADAYCIDSQDVFEEDDFNATLAAHKWGYTKPAWWADAVNKWVDGNRPRVRSKDNGKRSWPRLISFCCLHETAWVQKLAAMCPARLPIPSHDSFLCHVAARLSGVEMRRLNLKKRGVHHASRWKSIRDHICASPTAWNPYLSGELLRNVQIEITTACNMSCANCDRNCGMAPSAERMSLEQIKKFVAESIEAGHKWNRIDIIGGEPAVFPELEAVWALLDVYRHDNPGCKFRVTTNGRKEFRAPSWVKVRNSAKSGGPLEFEAANMAPCDEGIDDAEACSIPWRCGLGLTRYGYFLCGAGASVARVHGLDIGVRSLEGLTPEALKAQRDVLCRLCGHSRSTRHLVTEQATSPTWEAAFKAYKEKKPELELY